VIGNSPKQIAKRLPDMAVAPQAARHEISSGNILPANDVIFDRGRADCSGNAGVEKGEGKQAGQEGGGGDAEQTHG
jgi:hypothetical protein